MFHELTTQRLPEGGNTDFEFYYRACSYNHLDIVEILVSRRDFNPDVQDASGWTPLMIASSLQEGDALVDLLLNKGADVNCKSIPGS